MEQKKYDKPLPIEIYQDKLSFKFGNKEIREANEDIYRKGLK